ncbi:monocarboxylate transporter 13-like [Myxocyprinus asiaticus]|uniref:monocarboxylate transporter 13-like n=1 Tax=Myxocyprinus asiaticus TaxID=70543 RepID=UPI00222292E6|nr:monocarboxylate transporter 13-like [Myxocyprinus asiaticus]XP_051552178.1 monocarboxylate transporter 13-like [Myxocyprinus asiaticus]XP_051552179.1 monocarboxylate transporter 13-like [Myxocyprinus asiaticus]
MEKYLTDPPDGGYGWVVVSSSFFIMGLTAAVLKNFGLFFLEIQRHYSVLTSTTSWVTSTTIAVFHLGAPLASALSVHLSQRAVIMIGGLLAASGMVIASLGLSLPGMYLSMGVLQGLGMSLSWIPANSMVSHYFKHWRPIAYAIASSGECVFAMIFSLFFQWLIDSYSWQGSLLIIGGIQLNLCVCGALMRPLQAKLPSQTSFKGKLVLDPKEQSKLSKGVTFQWSLIQRPELLLYIVFAILAAAGFFIPPLFLVPYANSLGMEQYWAASILSVLALADLLGRLACGWLANLRLMRNLQLLTMVVTALGVVLLLLPIAQNYWAILVFSSLYGFLFGCVVAIHVTSIVDIVGLEGFDSALGLFMLLRSSGGFVGPPAAGWLVDWANDFSAGFYLSGLCLILSGVFVVLVDRLVEKNKLPVKQSDSCIDTTDHPINKADHTDV